MEALVELLLEIIFELLGVVLSVFLERVFDAVGSSKKALKITKIIVYTTIAVALLVLLTFSLIYKKGVLIILVLSYLVTILLAYYLIFIFNTVLDRPKGAVIVRWVVRVLRYVFMITLFVIANMVLEDTTAIILLMIGSAIGIIVYVCIDSYRGYQHNKKKNKNDKKEIKDIEEIEEPLE